MTYTEKLKSPHWQKKRLEILSRDKFTCRCCQSSERTLHVHHRYYERGKAPWEYPNEALLTLCEECHEYISKRLEMVNRVVTRGDSASGILMSFAELLDAQGDRFQPGACAFLYDVDLMLRSIRDARECEDFESKATKIAEAKKSLSDSINLIHSLILEVEEERQ